MLLEAINTSARMNVVINREIHTIINVELFTDCVKITAYNPESNKYDTYEMPKDVYIKVDENSYANN